MNIGELFSVETREATDSQAIVRLNRLPENDIVAIAGSMRGPRCRFAKTLPSMFSVKERGLDSKSKFIELLVTDPCYWSPQLPFYYDLELTVELADGSSQTLQHSLGLNRWECFAGQLRLEGRRTVLRGGAVETFDVSAARETGIAAMTQKHEGGFLREASEAGIPLIVDLREWNGDLSQRLAPLSWYPTVTFTVLDGSQTPGPLNGMKLAQAVGADATETALASWASAVLVELHPGERPPSWLRDCGRPVLVRQLLEETVSLADIRQQCDALQARLAPEFDFAGYFVG
ncbi:hypothetical protein [Adhaeretor mobilis]|uniref:Uncharacterized protein n=1 Tax=Adhaeretor mobilis TaxID=1930276 RepID=A0A517MT65_9BACT|nr:hypothetical protein [Adhaeretor mobilis]QDS98081.1 hypothetical protein HG15A2_13530 [Adhaeretor mobilis]